jgi:hypothetical protein
MMSVLEFEKKYKSILEKIDEWSYIRISFGFYLTSNPNINDSDSLHKETFFGKLKKILKKSLIFKNISFGFKNWFKNYDFIFFSDSNERRLIEGLYKDKIADDIIDRLPGKTLLIELPNDSHYRNVYSKHIVSESILLLFSLLLKFSIKSSHIKELDELLEKEGIKINYQKTIKYFNSQYVIYKKLLRIYKPKIVFVNCADCRMALVKAAHELGIKVAEVQHGVINDKHYAYVSDLNLNRSYYPDILLSFGLNETKIKNLIIKRVIPIGSYYLNYIKHNFKLDKRIKRIISKYKVIIGVTLQDLDWTFEGMIDFVKSLAKQKQNYLFILIPRKWKVEKNLEEKNIIIMENFYETIMYCNIHTTLYSTCCLEAPYLGIPNVLVDINGYASIYYKEILSPLHTKIVNNENDFFIAVEELLKLSKDEIIYNHKDFFVDYEENIKKAISIIIQEA